MTLKIPIPRKPNARFNFKPRGLKGFFAQVPSPPLPVRNTPFGTAGMCSFFVNAPRQPLPAKSIFPQFVMRQNGCTGCAHPCGRRGLGQDDGDFGSFGSDPISVDPTSGTLSGIGTTTAYEGPGLITSPAPSLITPSGQGDLSNLGLITTPETGTVTAAGQGDLSSGGFLTTSPVLGGTSGTAVTVPMSKVAPILAENAAEGISSVAPGVTGAISAATLTAAQLAALQQNPNLTGAQLQALAPPSGVSQWLAAKNSIFPSETNGSVLMVAGVLGVAGLIFANIASGKKRR